MPRFDERKSTPTPASPVKAEDGDARQALAQAIAAAKRAKGVVDALERAESEGFEHKMSLNRRLAELRERHAEEQGDATDSFIASLEGDALGVLATLDAPGEQRAREIEGVEREITAIARVRAEIEARIEPARFKAADADRLVTERAKAALAASLDVDGMLRDAEVAADWLRRQRVIFLHLLSIMPNGPEREAVSHFLARPWLIAEIDESWKRDPALLSYVDAHKALCADANAPVNIAP